MRAVWGIGTIVVALAIAGCTDTMSSEHSSDLSSCVFSQGFWKNHDPWPVASLKLGTVSYTEAQAKSILTTPVRSNGLVDLAHQLIAAKLNFASGASSPAFSAAIASADTLIGSLVVPPVGTDSLPTSTTSALVAQLDAFNSGKIDAGVCVGPQADVAITKTVDNAQPNVGDTIAFTVTVADNGPVTATGVVVDDLLPAGLAFVSAAPSQGTYDPATGLWQVGTVTTSTPQTLVVRATVTGSGSIANTAVIADADQFDPDTGNNAATVVVTPAGADLAITMTVDNHAPNLGDTITFMIILRDNGPSAATNVAVTDQLPPGLAFVLATPSQGTYDPATGTWAVGTVTTAAIQTLRIDARVTSPSAQANTAAIAHADQFDPDPGNNAFTVVVAPAGADLAVTMTVDNHTPNVGETISFMIILNDNGPSTATGVTVTDPLPPGLTFVLATPSQGTYDSATGTWSVGTITTAAIQTLRIDARVVAASAQTNTATISHADQVDPDPGNNAFSVVVAPAGADLALTNTVNNATPNVGDTISFMVILSDNGPGGATNVAVTDLLPAGLQVVLVTPSQGTYNATTGVWNVGTVTTTAIQTLRIDAQVVSPSMLVDTATISHADQFDPNLGNNAATVVVSPTGADVDVTMTVTNAQPNVGDTISFLVTLTNHGPSAASNVVVTDLTPAGLTFASATPSQGTYIANTGIWNAGTVTAGTQQTLLLSASVVSASPQTNTATITHADEFDPFLGNNAASITIAPATADLALAQTVSDTTPNVGDTLTWTTTVSNNGPSTATNVSVVDLLPAGLTFISATPSQGTYNASSGVWNIGTVTTATSPTLQVVAMVASPNTLTNTAAINSADQFDPIIINNSAAAIVTPQRADVLLAGNLSDPAPNLGDAITITIAVGNDGPSTATDLEVTTALPSQLTFVSAFASQGSYNNVTGQWLLGTSAAGSSPTLQLVVRVVGPNPGAVAATLTHADQFDPDLANNSISLGFGTTQADLTVNQTVSDPTPNVGDTVTFTVTVGDNGPAAATSVQLTDLLPAGVALVSAVPSQGTYNGTTGLWFVGTVSSPATLALTAQVTSASAQTSTATITASDQLDPATGNNTASATVTPKQADLAIATTVSNPTPPVGETITLTVTLVNHGPNAATNVSIDDFVPAGLTLVSASTSQGSYNFATGAWLVGSMSTATPQTLAIRAQVVTLNPLTNTASISHSDLFDPAFANNAATVTITPH